MHIDQYTKLRLVDACSKYGIRASTKTTVDRNAETAVRMELEKILKESPATTSPDDSHAAAAAV